MGIEELLEELGIEAIGNYSNEGSYVIEIDDSNEWGKYYSLLDDSEILNEIVDTTTITIDNSNITYGYEDKFELSLIADFKNDNYKLVVREI